MFSLKVDTFRREEGAMEVFSAWGGADAFKNLSRRKKNRHRSLHNLIRLCKTRPWRRPGEGFRCVPTPQASKAASLRAQSGLPALRY
jgi:hypothetical protein